MLLLQLRFGCKNRQLRDYCLSVTKGAPLATSDPTRTSTEATVPPTGAGMLFSIFIASIFTSRSPALTWSPIETATKVITPGRGAQTGTSPSPTAVFFAGAFAGAVEERAGAFLGVDGVFRGEPMGGCLPPGVVLIMYANARLLDVGS